MAPNRLRGQVKGELLFYDWKMRNKMLTWAFMSSFQALQAKVAKLSEEETDILKRQELLKKELYGRFGDSINLEN